MVFTGGTFMNVGGNLVRGGAKVDGVNFHDAIEGSDEDEIEVVGGAVRYIPALQYGATTNRVQMADIHTPMFTKLRDSKFISREYTNVAGNIDYVGAFKSALPSKGNLF